MQTTANLFSLSPAEQAKHLQAWAQLFGLSDEWQLLASVRGLAAPHYEAVAARLMQRLKAHPFTAHIGDLSAVFMGVMPFYFESPPLDASYLDNRARAGLAYLEAGFSAATLSAKYAILIDEWLTCFAELVDDAKLQAKLARAMSQVALFNYAVALEQFSYEREEKFFRAAGISRELFEQMARLAEGV